jgi:hypothetical protein
MVQTYEFGKFEVTDETVAFCEAWFEAMKGNYSSFDEFLRFKMGEAVKDYADKPDFSNFVLDYMKKTGHTREIKIPTGLYDELEAEAKKKGLILERFVEKLIEAHAF